jgi:hypothetical protein
MVQAAGFQRLVVTLLHRLAPCRYAAPSGCSILRVVSFTIPTHRRPRQSPRRLPWRGSPHPCKVFVKLSGSSSPTSTTAAATPHVTCTASAAAGFAASTFVLVQYDFAASVIASSLTSLLLQPPMASAPLHRSPSRNRSGALSASPSTWREVHTSPALRMLGAGNTVTCLCPRRVPVPGKLGLAPRLHRP